MRDAIDGIPELTVDSIGRVYQLDGAGDVDLAIMVRAMGIGSCRSFCKVPVESSKSG